jgi:hypothetical protein
MDMQKRLPNLTWAAILAIIVLSFLAATSPVHAACPPNAGECIAPPYAVAAEPVWASLNGVPQGNYPGANMQFDATVVNSDQPPDVNFTLLNETVTAPAFPLSSQSNYAIGLPIDLAPGQLIVNTITLPVPGNFSQSNFTADLVVYGALWNGTASIYLKLTASTVVTLLGLPIVGGGTTSSGSQSTTTTTTTTTITQSGTVSSSVLAAGVAIPSIVAVILLALLVRRGGGRPKGGP